MYYWSQIQIQNSISSSIFVITISQRVNATDIMSAQYMRVGLGQFFQAGQDREATFSIIMYDSNECFV